MLNEAQQSVHEKTKAKFPNWAPSSLGDLHEAIERRLVEGGSPGVLAEQRERYARRQGVKNWAQHHARETAYLKILKRLLTDGASSRNQKNLNL